MLKDAVTNTSRAYGQPIEIRHYGRTPGSFDLYEDDGKTFDYERGGYRVRRLRVQAGEAGSFALSERIVKDGAAPMFGAAELRTMTK
jgi:alpha-D-xyloside xylohydrolase